MVPKAVIKTTRPACMTSNPTHLFYLQKQGVLVAIDADLTHLLRMTGLLALMPQALPGAGPIDRFAAATGFRQRLTVHPGEHQQLTARMILNDDRKQPVWRPSQFIEPAFALRHRRTSMPCSAI